MEWMTRLNNFNFEMTLFKSSKIETEIGIIMVDFHSQISKKQVPLGLIVF